MSTFSYCPLVWMFYGKQADNIIKNTHRRALCALINNHSFSYETLLQYTNSISIHKKNLLLMLTEVYKTINQLNPPIMWGKFENKISNYNLRSGQNIKVPVAKSTFRRASIAWNYLPLHLKSANSISQFEAGTKNLVIYCTCKICSWCNTYLLVALLFSNLLFNIYYLFNHPYYYFYYYYYCLWLV